MAPTMRAIVRTKEGPRLADIARPVPTEGSAMLRVLLAGICRTDLYAADGLLPVQNARVLGHELVAEVLQPAKNSPIQAGAHVTVFPWMACNSCVGCSRAETCASPRVLGVDVDGAFAEEMVVPSACLHAVPRDWPLRRAAYVEPIAASMAVLRAPITREQRGAILGTGRIATLTARILALEGFKATLIETATAEHDNAFDYVVETNAQLDAAIRATRPEGLVVLKSRPSAAASLDLCAAVRKEIRFSSVAYAPFADAIAIAPKIPMDDLLGDVVPLERFEAAFARARESSSPKIFLAPHGDR